MGIKKVGCIDQSRHNQDQEHHHKARILHSFKYIQT